MRVFKWWSERGFPVAYLPDGSIVGGVIRWVYEYDETEDDSGPAEEAPA